jgi:hypothetical protein
LYLTLLARWLLTACKGMAVEPREHHRYGEKNNVIIALQYIVITMLIGPPNDFLYLVWQSFIVVPAIQEYLIR